MKVRVVTAAELTAEDLAAWSCLQRSDRALASPFFRPEFTLAVAAVRGDLRVGILEDGGARVGFFPFHLLPGNVGLPAGASISDFQGVIARRGLPWDATTLLAGCGLVAWRFDHLLASQPPFAPYHCVRAGSPYMDLSAGFAGYRGSLRAKGSRMLKQIRQKAGQAERQVGPLRVVLRVSDPQMFQKLRQWKYQQLGRAPLADGAPLSWTWKVKERIFAHQDESFSGMLSALWFGDRLAAIHFGLRSFEMLHSWVATYNPALAKYSPGTILTLEIAKACEVLGIRCIDLGRGAQQYKLRLMTGETALAEGAVDLRLLRGALWRVWLRTHDWVRHSRFQAAAQRVNQALGDPCARFGLRVSAPQYSN